MFQFLLLLLYREGVRLFERVKLLIKIKIHRLRKNQYLTQIGDIFSDYRSFTSLYPPPSIYDKAGENRHTHVIPNLYSFDCSMLRKGISD